MGGNTGGNGFGSRKGIEELTQRVREDLERAKTASVPNVFLSFAHEDLDEVNLLRGQAKNERTGIEFRDWSVREPYNSERADYIRQRISERIQQCSLTVVYLSRDSATSPWVDWEIKESLKHGKRVMAVHKGTTPPRQIPKAVSDNKIKIVPWSSLADEIKKKT
jgi:hypothetical protein